MTHPDHQATDAGELDLRHTEEAARFLNPTVFAYPPGEIRLPLRHSEARPAQLFDADNHLLIQVLFTPPLTALERLEIADRRARLIMRAVNCHQAFILAVGDFLSGHDRYTDVARQDRTIPAAVERWVAPLRRVLEMALREEPRP